MKRKLMTMVTAASLATGVLGQTAQAGAFPSSSCQPGYFQQGPRLCMTAFRQAGTAATAIQNPTVQTFQNAEIDCQDIKGRVSDYNDWRYRRFRGDGVLVFTDGAGTWLGPRTGDNLALFANGQFATPANDFDGESSVFATRFYTCSHDDNL